MGDDAHRMGKPGSRRIIGLTGNIATGKSTVAALLAERGAYVIDMDRKTREALQSDGPGFGPVVEAFGREIVNAGGEIDRPQLGSIVFADPAQLRKLEAILHPVVYEMAVQELAQTPAEVVIIEAIKLLEANTTRKLCDETWVVISDPEVQLDRLHATRGMSRAEGQKRLANQSSQEWKMARADRIVYNQGTLDELAGQLDRLWIDMERE